MKKGLSKKIKVVFVILVIALLVVFFVSVGLFDWVKNLSGKTKGRDLGGELKTLIGASEINQCSKLSNEIIDRIDEINQENIVSGAIIFLNSSYWDKEDIEVGKSRRISVTNVPGTLSLTYYDVTVVSVSGGVVRVKVELDDSEETLDINEGDSAFVNNVNVAIFESYENKKKNEVVVKEGEIVNNANKSYVVLPIRGEGGVIMSYKRSVLTEDTTGETYPPTFISDGRYRLIVHGNIFNLTYSNGNYRFTWDPENEIDVFGNCEPNWICNDTDVTSQYLDGINVYSKGIVYGEKFNEHYEDYCAGSESVNEYYCNDAALEEEVIECPDNYKCYGGECFEGCVSDEDCEEDFECDEKYSNYKICICKEIWNCTSWTECNNGYQTRHCIDMNECGTSNNIPNGSRRCDNIVGGGNGDVQVDQNNNLNEGNGDVQVDQNHQRPKSYIQTKEVSVERNVRKNTLTVEDNTIETSLDVIEESEKIYIKTSSGNKEMKILPEEASSRAKKISDVKEIEISEYKGLGVYSITGTKKARLFFIFPVNADVEQGVNVENGDLVYTKKPWWHFLALGV